MTYTRTILAEIGRHLVNTQPEIAGKIIEQIPVAKSRGIAGMDKHLVTYCQLINITPDDIQGAVWNRERSEDRKVFISAMMVYYSTPFRFNATVATVLGMHAQDISTIRKQVEFRFRKDSDFRSRVNELLNLLP